jgi:hypothetical protein
MSLRRGRGLQVYAVSLRLTQFGSGCGLKHMMGLRSNELRVYMASKPVARLVGLWVFVAFVAGGCAPQGATPEEQTRNALLIAGVSGVFMLAMWLANRLLGQLGLPPETKGGFLGFLFGLVAAVVIMKRVPLGTQLFVIGAIAGVGTDFISGIKETSGPRTVVERIAAYVSQLTEGVRDAAVTTSLKRPSTRLISSGLWVFIATILFTLIIGNVLY